MNVDDYNEWRAQHPTLTFADQQTFMNRAAAAHPLQRSATVREVKRFCWRLPDGATIIELGGWDGHTAATVLENNDKIAAWRNIELWEGAAAASICDDPRYEIEILTDWAWSKPIVGDAFIATHVIEHLTAVELERLIGALCTNDVLVEAPIGDGDRTDVTWNDYHGSHILEWEWGPVGAAFERAGLMLAGSSNDTRTFRAAS